MKKLSLFGMIALFVALVGYAAEPDDSMRGMENMHGDGMSSGQHQEMTHFSFGKPGTASVNVDRTVTITIEGIRFIPNQIDVHTGETIRFVIKNTSAIEHELTLGDSVSQTIHREEMLKAATSGVSTHKHHGGNTVTIPAGQTAMLLWTFAGPGNLEFDCNIPGHYEGGMKGAITVTP